MDQTINVLLLYMTVITYTGAVMFDSMTINDDTKVHRDSSQCLRDVGGNVMEFEVLPGAGWDNLVNKEMDTVFDRRFFACKMSEDRKYLLPDGVRLIPRKSSNVQTMAELIAHWDNYTSTTAHTVNVQAGASFGLYHVSGQYSDEYQSVKTHQYNDQSATTRIQLRYVLYTAKLDHGMPLSATFKKRLQKIATLLQLNHKSTARYESQMLVRDFGTHVITSIDVGAALVQVDHIEKQYTDDQTANSKKHDVLAAASAQFFFRFKLSLSTDVSWSSDDQTATGYSEHQTSSNTMTIGGPVFRPQNFSPDAWVDGLDNNLVALDRVGEPIYYAIDASNLPDVPSHLIQQVYDLIQKAVVDYYNHNVYRGCTEPNKPNFNLMANVDDGTCKSAPNNLTFGGLYQTCDGYGPKLSDLCNGLTILNNKTGDFTCPDMYQPYLIDTNNEQHSHQQENCDTCHFIVHWKCRCKAPTTVTDSQATVKTYWCAAAGPVPANSGYMFGGLYTSQSVNIATQSKSCPTRFWPVNVLDHISICLSDDYELASEDALPFSGFYSCHSGNPLSKTPMSCPDGYSQHVVDTGTGCEVYYCIQTGAISLQGLPQIRPPPFMKFPYRSYTQDSKNALYIMNGDGSLWNSVKIPNDTKATPVLLTDNGLVLVISQLTPMTNASEIGLMIDLPTTRKHDSSINTTAEDANIEFTTLPSLKLVNDLDVEADPKSQHVEQQPSVGLTVACSVLGTLLTVFVCVFVCNKIKRKEHGVYREL